MWIRDEHRTMFGRQVLTLWSGQFATEYEGEAVGLPGHNGYTLTMYLTHVYGEKIRVTCPSPRDEENYLVVDESINAAIKKARK